MILLSNRGPTGEPERSPVRLRVPPSAMDNLFDKAREEVAEQADLLTRAVDRVADSSMGAIDSVESLWLRAHGKLSKTRFRLSEGLSTGIGSIKGQFDASSLHTVASEVREKAVSGLKEIASFLKNLPIFNRLASQE